LQLGVEGKDGDKEFQINPIFAFLVVVSHSDFIYESYAKSPDLSLQYAFGFGAVGVHIFFVISGFVMFTATFGVENPISWRVFLQRRFAPPEQELYTGRGRCSENVLEQNSPPRLHPAGPWPDTE
jgi:hypothetical protein